MHYWDIPQLLIVDKDSTLIRSASPDLTKRLGFGTMDLRGVSLGGALMFTDADTCINTHTGERFMLSISVTSNYYFDIYAIDGIKALPSKRVPFYAIFHGGMQGGVR